MLPQFPGVIDSTMLLAYKTCPRKFYNSYVRRRCPKGESIHLVAGGAFAAGIERARRAFYSEGRSQIDSIDAGIEAILRTHTIHIDDLPERFQPKAVHRIAEGLVHYAERWPFASDYLQPLRFPTGHGIEFSFAVPLPITHPDTSDPLLYAGRLDMLASYRGEGVFGVDEKTSGQLGPQWANGFHLRGQFIGYAWAANEHGYKVSGLMVRGVGLLKNEIRLEEQIVYMPSWKINRWYVETLQWVERMIEDYRNGYFAHNFGDGCASYGGCQFLDACNTGDPDRILAFDFEHNDWTPIRKQRSKIND